MEFEMYESDLTPFSGDLLDSWRLFEDLVDYDSLKTDIHGIVDSPVDEFLPSKDDIETLVSNLGSIEPDQGIDVATWMEDKVNLLDILMDNDQELSSDEQITALSSTFDDVSAKLSDSVDTLQGLVTHQSPDVVQQVNLLDSAMTASFSASDDSGVDLSIEDTGQDLMELLPQQLIESIEETSSTHPLLLENFGDVIVDAPEASALPLPTLVDAGNAPKYIESTILDIPLGVVEVEPTIPLTLDSSDMDSASSSSLSVVIPAASSPQSVTTVDLAQYFALQSSPSQSSCSSPVYSGGDSPAYTSSGRSSPYAREFVVESVSSRGMKSVSGDPKDRTHDKKLRKMRQNKDAATRYRIKKKQESDTINVECEKLQKRNDELRDQIDTMTREIEFLKELFANVNEEKAKKASKHTPD